MNPRFRFGSIVLGAALLLSAAAVTFAQGPGGPGFQGGPRFGQGPGFRHGPRFGRGGPGMLHQRLIEELQLTEDQLAQLDQLRQQHRDEVQALRDQQRTLRRELRSLLESESPSAADVGEKVIAVHNLRNQIRDKAESFRESFRALLTPEQLQRLDELKANRPGRRGWQ